MSAMRNAVPQRPYRERDQPRSRSRYGMLEKHKDYSARAKDYNVKKARIKALRQKVAGKNEDEFHFGMMSSRTKDGVKVTERGNQALSNDAVKLLKTQDAGYLRTIRAHTMKERERLESQLHIAGNGSQGGPSLRATRDDEAEQASFQPETWFDTDEIGLKRTFNRPRRKSSENQTLGEDKPAEDNDEDEVLERTRQRAQAKLEALRERERQLLAAEQELETQRAKMKNTTGGVNKHGVKFKVRERKR